jgi:hypothetical protein
MPIQAAPLVPQRMELTSLDESGDTFVWVRPATGREKLQRGELLKDRVFTQSGLHSSVNPVALQNLEIWLTAGNGDGDIGTIVVEYDGGETRTFFDKKKVEYTRADFIKELNELPDIVIATWHAKVIEVNPGWMYPF